MWKEGGRRACERVRGGMEGGEIWRASAIARKCSFKRRGRRYRLRVVKVRKTSDTEKMIWGKKLKSHMDWGKVRLNAAQTDFTRKRIPQLRNKPL